ncbi:MAG TPA: hypothetical protein VGQ06_11510 [Gemmatimonadales bacterium]|jgi:hypothetical protein|nr:hypothetical protein [Gemmatimonadales bacterium]
MGRGLGGALVLAVSLGAAAPVYATPSVPPDTAAEPVLVELQIGRITRATVQAYRVRSEVLLPLSQFFQLVEVRHRLSPEGRLEAAMDPGNRRIAIDVHRDTMQFGERRVRLEPEFRLFEGGELYVGAERLGDLFGLRFAVDWAELTVTVVDPGDLPIARRLRRETAREAYLRRAEGPRAEVTLGLERPRWDGVVLDYSLSSPSEDPIASAAYSLGLGADLGGGSLEVLALGGGPALESPAQVDASWTGVWRDHRWLTQLRLGDAASTGPRGRSLRGVMLTNAPFVRPSLVGALRYAGRLEPGWSVEAYRGGDLVAFDSTDVGGGFAIDLPVRYGENPVDFVAYGPFGEIREFNRTYRVLAELLPAGRFEYGMSAGQCRSVLCDATANLDLRYGASPRWTVQAGFDQFWRDALPDRLHPYGTVVANPTNSWALQADVVGGAFARGGVRYEPSVDLRFEGVYTRFARDTAPVFTVAGRTQWALSAFVRPKTEAGFFFFDGHIEQLTTDVGRTTRTRVGASIQKSEVRLLPYVRTDHDIETRAFAGLNTFVVPRPQWGRFLGAMLVRTATEVQSRGGGGLASWSAFASRPVGRGMRLEIGGSWQRGAGGLTYSLTLTSYFAAARAVTAVTAPPDRSATATQFVQGSVLWDRQAGRVGLAPGPSLERSGLSGRVFLDENANGRRDIGEPGVANVRVLVGSIAARTDSSGGYRVWDLVPFEPVLISVDSLSLDSPLLVPAFGRVSIVPGPNRFRSLDIPVVQAGVIEGRVVRAGRGVGGVTLILTERRTGAQRTLVTFTDGAFYLMSVKPGSYDLTVDPRVLDALGVDADPLPFTLAPTPNGVGRSDLELRLKPRF